MSNIVVLTTSDIFRVSNTGPPKGCKSEVKDEFDIDGNIFSSYSTGLFEKAIAEGKDIYVGSTRVKLLSGEKWWSEQIPSDHIFMRRDLDEPSSEAWKRLFDAIGIEWPIDDLGPVSWIMAVGVLREKGIMPKLFSWEGE